MKDTLLASVAVLAAAAALAAPPILPFDEVRPGMKGTARTVFRGTEIETVDVEILGTIPRIGPDQNLILARCSGGPLAETGIIAGMSGSPVTVDGKLVGAVAYSWPFSKEPIAGITPIEEMLRDAGAELGAPRARPGGGAGPTALTRLFRPERLASFFPGALYDAMRRPDAALSATVPLAVSGLGADGFARVLPDLQRAGFAPVQGGSLPAATASAAPLVPGSAVGIKLARGDVDMTATGTVTWVEGDRLLAFGHSLYGLGPIDLPMTAARAEAILPTLAQSQRIAVPLGEVGAFRQDRTSAISGRIGATSRMIPVRVQVGPRGGTSRSFAFDVADDPLLAPILLYTSLNGVLAAKERVFGSVSLRLREGSVIKVDGLPDVEIDNLYAGDNAPFLATGIPAYILYVLMNNDWTEPRVAGVNLILEYEGEPRSGRVLRATLDRYRVRAGDEVTVTVILAPFRGRNVTVSRSFTIPPETPPGRLLLFVGNAAALNRVEGEDENLVPRDLPQLIRLVNHLRRNDRVYVLAAREDSGVILEGERMPNLPPSAMSLLSRPRSHGNFTLLPRRGILEEEIPAEFAVDGLTRVQVEVEAP